MSNYIIKHGMGDAFLDIFDDVIKFVEILLVNVSDMSYNYTRDEIAPIMFIMADEAYVSVCVHLDHGTGIARVKKAIDLILI